MAMHRRMRRWFGGTAALALGALLLNATPTAWAQAVAPAEAAAAKSCQEIDRAARVAEMGLDLDGMAAALDRARAPGSGCDAGWTERLARDLANLHVNVFFVRTESPGGGPAHMLANLPVLHAGRAFAETWQLLLTLAEVHYELGDYDAAAPLYREAVAMMTEAAEVLPEGSTEARILPSAPEFEMIHGRMTQSALLAAAYEPPPARRSAADDGLFVESWRGFRVKAVPVPIQFEFGSTEFTPKGGTAAEHLAGYLKASGLTTVTLVGHTDPLGDEAANQALSEARAVAVRDFLAASGFEGTVVTLGKGESEPFRPVDAARFAADPAALHALDRRVELVR